MPKKELWESQIQDLGFALANPRSMNLSEPGTGKTGVAAVLSYWKWVKEGKKSIWVQPNHLRFKNRRELIDFTEFTAEDVEVLEKASEVLGKHKRRSESRACQETGFIDYIASSTAKVFVVGFTFLKTYYEELLEHHPEIDLVVVDEGHLGYKTNGSKATQSLYNIMREVSGFYYMTGSPIDGRLDNIFPAIHIIEPRYYGSYRGFIGQHAGFIDDYNRVLWWVNGEKVTEILDRHSVRRTWKEIHGDQKRWVEIIDDVDMMPEMRAAYEEFDQLAMLELDNFILDGTNPGVATIRARQIIGHPETMFLCKNEVSGKDQMLQGYAEDAAVNGGGLVVYASLVPEVERNAQILRNAGLRVGMMHGQVSPKVRDRIDQMYQNGELDAISATPAVAATGYNWQRTRHMVYTSLDYKDSNLEQSIKRGERELRDEPLRVTILQYDNSVDQAVFKVIQRKDQLAQTILVNV